ncbi:MAG: aminotransferase class V-fold PLP-dependent enzyme [Deltaproteobacteria bacterium]
MKTVYLDNAATSFPKPESVYAAMDHFNRNLGGNPGRGSHQATRSAGSVVLEAREALAALFNVADSSRIAFTMNITEAINLALKGILVPGDHVITTSMEHNAVARPLHVLSGLGVEWTRVICSGDGSLDPEDIRRAIRPNTRLICLLHASNLTGTIMPIKEVGKIARENGIIFMVDSAQTAGVLPLDAEEYNIDILTFTGHKALLGPQGTGGLYVRPGLIIKPLKEGGTGSLSESLVHPEYMPDRLESGTLNTPGIAGLAAGVAFIRDTGLEHIRQHELKLTRALLAGLQEIKGVKVYGPEDPVRRVAVVAFNIEDRDCGDVSMNLDLRFGIIARSGLHCAPLAHQTIGSFELGACRLSPGLFNTMEDIEYTVKAIDQLSRE